MRRPHGMLAVAMAAALFASGCYGPFYLTRRVHQWNGEVSDNKWVVEVVFLVCAWLPVYGIATAADAIIFNSVEFWTGENPLKKPIASDTTRRIARGDTETVMKRSGDELVIQQFQRGTPGPMLRLRRDGNGTIALNNDGAVLFSSETLADGSVVVRDGEHRQVATYSKEQAQQFLASLPQ